MGFKNSIRSLDAIETCAECGQKNRYLITADKKKYKCGKCGRPLFKWITDYEEVKKQDKKFIEKLLMALIVLLFFAFGYWNYNGSGGYSKDYDHPHHSGNP